MICGINPAQEALFLPRPKKINPCAAKGRYCRRSTGVSYKRSWKKNKIPPVGCELNAPYSLETPEGHVMFAGRSGGAEFGPRTHDVKASACVVPCEGAFRYFDSPGSKQYRKLTGYKFSCQAVEEKLFVNKEVQYLPDAEQSSATENQWILWSSEILAIEEIAEDTSVSAPPEEEESQRFKSFLSQLTYKQKSVVERLYLRNYEGKTYEEVAKSLRISVDSLKDRRTQIKKKLESLYPEFAGIKVKKTKLNAAQDLQEDGFFRKSLAKPYPLYRVDPVTGEKTRVLPPRKKSSRTPIPGLRTHLLWMERTNYYPESNGTFSHDPMEEKRVIFNRKWIEEHKKLGTAERPPFS